MRNIGLATLFGIIVAGGLVALLEHLDISIRARTTTSSATSSCRCSA